MTERINDFTDFETAAEQFQEAISTAYTENCPLSMRRNYRNIPWWSKDLAERRNKVRRLFNLLPP
jgi:hypothetical protein